MDLFYLRYIKGIFKEAGIAANVKNKNKWTRPFTGSWRSSIKSAFPTVEAK
jgi:hypothetical protein